MLVFDVVDVNFRKKTRDGGAHRKTLGLSVKSVIVSEVILLCDERSEVYDFIYDVGLGIIVREHVT